MENKMFCYQCQETAGCKGCSVRGVCGKTPEVAALQDLLIYVTKGCAALTTALRSEGKEVSYEVNHRITLNLFTTITNANFDGAQITKRIADTLVCSRSISRSRRSCPDTRMPGRLPTPMLTFVISGLP